MFYVLDEQSIIAATAASEGHFVRSALAVFDRTERHLAGSPPSQVPQDADYVLRLANFSAELFACIQLWQWEESGEVRYLGQSLPTFDEAVGDLKARIVAEPRWFLRTGPSGSKLFELVAGVRAREYRFSPELGGVFLVAELDEDTLVEASRSWLSNYRSKATDCPKRLDPGPVLYDQTFPSWPNWRRFQGSRWHP